MTLFENRTQKKSARYLSNIFLYTTRPLRGRVVCVVSSLFSIKHFISFWTFIKIQKNMTFSWMIGWRFHGSILFHYNQFHWDSLRTSISFQINRWIDENQSKCSTIHIVSEFLLLIFMNSYNFGWIIIMYWAWFLSKETCCAFYQKRFFKDCFKSLHIWWCSCTLQSACILNGYGYHLILIIPLGYTPHLCVPEVNTTWKFEIAQTVSMSLRTSFAFQMIRALTAKRPNLTVRHVVLWIIAL